jgi:hypothetical protein
MIQIAENIQTLHNSLASDIVGNSLSAKTVLLRTDDFKITTDGKHDDDNNYKNVLAGIGELYATLTHVGGLKEDLKYLDPQFRKSQDEESSALVTDLETVIEFSNMEGRQGNC